MGIVYGSCRTDIYWLADGPIGPYVDAFKRHLSAGTPRTPSPATWPASRISRAGRAAGACGCPGSTKGRSPIFSMITCRTADVLGLRATTGATTAQRWGTCSLCFALRAPLRRSTTSVDQELHRYDEHRTRAWPGAEEPGHGTAHRWAAADGPRRRRRGRHQGREDAGRVARCALQPDQRLEEPIARTRAGRVRRRVGTAAGGRLERVARQDRAALHAFGGQGWAGNVAAQLLQRLALVGADATDHLPSLLREGDQQIDRLGSR